MRKKTRDRTCRRAALILAAAGMIPLAGWAAPVYFNDFESGLGPGWSGVSGSYADGSGIYTDLAGQSVLGLFYRDETVTLTVPAVISSRSTHGTATASTAAARTSSSSESTACPSSTPPSPWAQVSLEPRPKATPTPRPWGERQRMRPAAAMPTRAACSTSGTTAQATP